MKFGVREICDVVLKKKAAGFFGKLYLDKDMPVLYFDTLKTSSLEGQATTVYAQGGRGNPRLVAWEGDKTVTFTMEDALISPESFSILSGAGLLDASENDKLYVHTTQQVEVDNQGEITLDRTPSDKGEFYLMVMTEDGSIDVGVLPMLIPSDPTLIKKVMNISDCTARWESAYRTAHEDWINDHIIAEPVIPDIKPGDVVYVDYYVEAASSVKQINIEASKFGGSYYLEASTLFRDQASGDDYPAEFIIPNCKVQSNFTFTLSPTGDPSTFTFTMDAFPDYTKFDKTKKVLAAIQIIESKDSFGKGNSTTPTGG